MMGRGGESRFPSKGWGENPGKSSFPSGGEQSDLHMREAFITTGIPKK